MTKVGEVSTNPKPSQSYYQCADLSPTSFPEAPFPTVDLSVDCLLLRYLTMRLFLLGHCNNSFSCAREDLIVLLK
jgi:hypothetical protein